MFDIGWMEMLAIATIALIVIGPKDLPKAIKTVSEYVGRARAMARELREGLDDIVRESELKELKDEFDQYGHNIEAELDESLAVPETGETNDFIKSLDAAEAAEKAAAEKAQAAAAKKEAGDKDKKPAKTASKAKPAARKAAAKKTTGAKTTSAKTTSAKTGAKKTAASRSAAAKKTTGSTKKATGSATGSKSSPSQRAGKPKSGNGQA